LSWFPSLRNSNAIAYVTPEELNVTTALLGQPLASAWSRLYAILIDLIAVAIIGSLAGAAGLWLFAGVVAIGYLLRRWPRGSSRMRQGWAAVLLVMIVAATAYGVRDAVMSADPKAVVAALDEDELPKVRSATSDAARIIDLQEQLAAARKPKHFEVSTAIHDAVSAIGLSFSWAVLYFTLVPCWWNGQTLGKKILGLRVVELTGKPMTLVRCFGRYGGYAAGLATGLMGFAQIFWDVNRQAVQDKIAHTVVVSLRGAKAG